MQLSCHSVAVVFTLVRTKQIRINIHKRNNTKTQYKPYKTQYIQVYTHTLQNPHIHTPTHYKITHTHTDTLQNPHIQTPTHYKTHTLQNPHLHTSTYSKTS